jgi:microcystin-dependent protein
MSVNLSPIGNGFQFFTTTGLPLNGGFLYTYQAGSSTPLTTYSDNGGVFPNTNPIVLGTDGRPQVEIWLTYGYNYKFVLADSSNNVIQTYDNLYGIIGVQSTSSGGGTTIPSGLIAIWSGATGSIPSGWQLCDGTNGTPDLRNSFVLGAGNSYSVGQTGGSTDAIVVSHTHTATSTSTVTDPGHYHSDNGQNSTYGSTSGPDDMQLWSGSHNTGSAVTGITVATATTNQTTGTSGSNANMPPYYALAYIFKI